MVLATVRSAGRRWPQSCRYGLLAMLRNFQSNLKYSGPMWPQKPSPHKTLLSELAVDDQEALDFPHTMLSLVCLTNWYKPPLLGHAEIMVLSCSLLYA
jgi:hypothetical protein